MELWQLVPLEFGEYSMKSWDCGTDIVGLPGPNQITKAKPYASPYRNRIEPSNASLSPQQQFGAVLRLQA